MHQQSLFHVFMAHYIYQSELNIKLGKSVKIEKITCFIFKCNRCNICLLIYRHKKAFNMISQVRYLYYESVKFPCWHTLHSGIFLTAVILLFPVDVVVVSWCKCCLTGVLKACLCMRAHTSHPADDTITSPFQKVSFIDRIFLSFYMIDPHPHMFRYSVLCSKYGEKCIVYRDNNNKNVIKIYLKTIIN